MWTQWACTRRARCGLLACEVPNNAQANLLGNGMVGGATVYTLIGVLEANVFVQDEGTSWRRPLRRCTGMCIGEAPFAHSSPLLEPLAADVIVAGVLVAHL